MSAPQYIVTGGAGFIGSNLVAELLKRDPGCGVMVVDDFRSGTFANLIEACTRKGVGPFTGEIVSDSVGELNWQPAITGLEPKAVFHLAAITDTTVADEQAMMRDNTEGFAEMVTASAEAGVPLVYASSAATYGTPPQTATREPFPLEAAGEPNNVYGFSKWMMEVEHRRITDERAAEGESIPPVVGLRFFNVFGPCEAGKGHMASMVFQLATQVLTGKTPRLFAPGDQARDQVFVDDVVDCTLAAAGLGSKPDPVPGVYNLGSGRATSFNAIVKAINKALDRDENTPPEYFEMPASIRRFYQDFTCADMSMTATGLGWQPKHDPVEAMVEYVAYLAEHPKTWQAGAGS